MVQPGYLRIADELRARIRSGAQPPGSRLPTLRQLAVDHQVSLATVRQAVTVLRLEGLVETRTRAGTIVRPRPPVHRLAPDRYRTPLPGPRRSTPFTVDQRMEWSEYRLDKRFERRPADAELAALFEIEPGEPLLARHFVFHDAGQPAQLSTSHLRWSDVAGTPVADPINEPWPGGTRAQLGTLGIRVERITEAFTAGMPTREEAEALRIGAGVPVLRCTRRHLAAGGRVVEVAHPIVRRADCTVVEFSIDISD
jgi:GntR family transcriptional regulator